MILGNQGSFARYVRSSFIFWREIFRCFEKIIFFLFEIDSHVLTMRLNGGVRGVLSPPRKIGEAFLLNVDLHNLLKSCSVVRELANNSGFANANFLLLNSIR